MPSLVRRDAFSPVLLTSVPLAVTEEQKNYVKNILDVACSDTRFAEKAYIAINRALTSQPAIPPMITALSPNGGVIGSPSFVMHVLGTGFTPASKIIFNGFEEPTTYVSATDISTGINMDVWHAAAVLPVAVMNSDGVISDVKNFTFTV